MTDSTVSEDEMKYFSEYFINCNDNNKDDNDIFQQLKRRKFDNNSELYIHIRNSIKYLYDNRKNDKDILSFTECRNEIINIDAGRLFKIYSYLVKNKIINKYLDDTYLLDLVDYDDNNSSINNNNNNNINNNNSILSKFENYYSNEDISLHNAENLHKSLQQKRIELIKNHMITDIETNFEKDEIGMIQKLGLDKESQAIALTFALISNECEKEEQKETQKLEGCIDDYIKLRYECLQQKVKLLEQVEQIIDIQRKRNENNRRDNQIDRARLAQRLPMSLSLK